MRRISKQCKCGCGGVVRRSSDSYIRGHKTPTVLFWQKVRKKGPNDCWEWTGATTDNTGRPGYGHGVFTGGGRIMATHFMWCHIKKRIIPPGKFVLHRCNNPPCVNPRHLFIGTGKRNSRQMYDENRGPDNRGENSGRAKLTQRQVDRIRTLRKRGWTYPALAVRFGVCPANVSHICNRRSWKC